MRRLVYVLFGAILTTALSACGGSSEGTTEMKPTDMTPFEDMKKQMIENMKKNSKGVKLPPAVSGKTNAKGK
ncbi:hypothetical protein [Singulisphaera sp. PoT]|uniref:hypothetical protein n=1 Tax=Singulisphaera sp. PoT TaxID=3411797 RepID=UPI003BF5A7AD